MARTFPGTTLLIWIGAIMTCFPIFYAVIVNDMRRVLAYSLLNQVGFMVCGIGIGSELAINGAASHATDVEKRLEKQKAVYPLPFRYWASSSAVFCITVMLVIYLLLFYIKRLSTAQ